jgi:hypothetical protein
MPLTLRQHVARAMEILSCLGGPTILPSPSNVIVKRRRKKAWMRNPKQSGTRPDTAGDRMRYAIDVKKICEAYDRTSWMVRWLTSSDDAASSVWASIPDKVICFACRYERRIPDCRCKGRCRCRECPKCGKKMPTYVGIVCADLKHVAEALRNGKIPVAEEKA